MKNLFLRVFTLLIFGFVGSFSFSQATLFSDDFESITTNWSVTDDLLPNFWLQKICAGNGPTNGGTQAQYISKGGSVAGCGGTGESQHAYMDAPSGTLMATTYISVDATCASNIQVQFDYSIDGIPGEDFGELVYSIDGGSTFIAVGGELPQSASWTTTTIGLPGAVDGIVFHLGFRFTYNDVTVAGSPLAIDNVIVTGTDVISPIMTCPTSIDLPVNTSCVAICDDYTKDMLTLSDNCTDSAFMLVTQNVPEFTVFPSSPGGFESITLTAFDESGNSTQCTITLNVIDDFAPSITCPADTNVYVDINCDGMIEDYTGDAIISDNCSSLGNLLVSQSPVAGTIINGTIIDTPVTLTVTDESGNMANCIFIARTLDTMVATISCPVDTNVYLNNSCDGYLEDYTGDAVVYDNCTPLASLTISQSPPAGTLITANQVVTLTVSGAIPNIDQSCTFNAFIVDTISPQIVCPSPVSIFVDNFCQGAIPDYTVGGVITENCTVSPTVTQSPIAGTIVTVNDNITIVLTVTDDSGNSGQCQFSQPIFDNILPTITCPSDQTVNADANCFATLLDYTGSAVAADNCTAIPTVTQNPVPGTNLTGTTTIMLTVEDESNNTNTCMFDVNIIDVTAPVVTCPSNSNESTGAGCMYSLADFTGMASAADNCTPALSISYTQTPAPSTSLATGVHTITIDGTDGSGNTGSCTFDITVSDLQAPAITVCASNQNLISDSNCEATIGDYTGLITAIDNCSAPGNIVITQSPTAGTVISTTTLITITATDENLNQSTCSFNVILTDTISPTVICPGNQSVAINGSCGYTMPDLSGSIGGTDNCSVLANMTISQNPLAGTSQTGQTAVLITLTDEQGNNSTCITNMIPIDMSDPTINCPSPAPQNIGSLCDYALPNYGTTASVLDNCSGYSISQTPSVGTIVNIGTTTVTLTVTDVGGNTDQCSFDLLVFETELPTIICPSDISTCDPVAIYTDPSFSDNCLVSMTQTDGTGLSSGMAFPVGITTVEYTATDSSGNTQMCSFDIEILDFPSSANIAIDTILLCNQTSTVVDADPITSGSGLWTVVSGQGNFNNQFANSTGVNNIGIGTNVYAWTVSSGSCGTLYDTIIVINVLQDLPASTQDTAYACMNTDVTLQSNTPLYGIGTWTTNGSGAITDINSSNTTSTLSNGWQDFIWTITNGSCPATSDTLHVFAMQQPAIDQLDTLVCVENDLISLSASSPAFGQTSTWSVVSGSASIESPNSVVTDVDNFGLGNTMILYTLSNPICGNVSDTIIVSSNLCEGFQPVIPTVITPGNLDGKNDVFTIDFLNVIHPECHVVIFNRWGSIVFESTGYESPWNGTYKGNALPMGTYFYRIELNDGSGEVLTGDISIIN